MGGCGSPREGQVGRSFRVALSLPRAPAAPNGGQSTSEVMNERTDTPHSCGRATRSGSAQRTTRATTISPLASPTSRNPAFLSFRVRHRAASSGRRAAAADAIGSTVPMPGTVSSTKHPTTS